MGADGAGSAAASGRGAGDLAVLGVGDLRGRRLGRPERSAAGLARPAAASADVGRILRLGRRFGRADGVAVGLVDQIGIDRDLVLERAGQRRIGVVADQCVVERGQIAVLTGLAAGRERRAPPARAVQRSSIGRRGSAWRRAP